MVKHNNVICNVHCRKDWQRRVKTWFNQPAKKKKRRDRRAAKAKDSTRPAGTLRPAVRCPTFKYNSKVRAGRGFSLDELKAAGISRYEARLIGVRVDHRRRNKSVETFEVNVQRLNDYKANLVRKTRRGSKDRKAGTATVDWENKVASIRPTRSSQAGVTSGSSTGISFVNPATIVDASCYKTIRIERMHERNAGARMVREAEAAKAQA